MTSAAHAKKSAMGLPIEERLSGEDLIVTVESIFPLRGLWLAFDEFNKGFC
ncbi:hypothetical protein KX729_18390 [Rhizobium sp. XQZ8]|uniref:hypothetical protein n=1 Tax=Rhizobium populisoli TaxID=2859785 RepID=UPI001CA5570C|nr:hypothetical protein [Rhizobium populisoli]MBW6423430.1 hypothetical protein [Rhizobium populisoli]